MAEIDGPTFTTLRDFMEALRSLLSKDELEAIFESAMHSGRPEAVAWLDD